MSLVDDLRSGYKAGTFNNSPLVPNAAWYQKLPLNTASTVGLTLFGYVQCSEFSSEKIFDLDVSETTENNSIFANLTASTSDTAQLSGSFECFITFGFIEDSTGENHVLYRGLVPVRSGVV